MDGGRKCLRELGERHRSVSASNPTAQQAQEKWAMADQAALQQKYAPAGQAVSDFSQQDAKIDGIFMDGDKLVLKCEVPSKVVGNRVWDAVKQCDPNYPDFELQMTQTGPDAQPYTIQSGENLSKIAQHFYGKASGYEAIAKANNIDNPDHIQVGQNINIPPLS
jgi:nucleoid-associated protein YgaU